MFKTILIPILCWSIHWQVYAHPIHVSVMNIVINDNEGETTISFRFYKDDLSLALSHAYGEHIYIIDTVRAQTVHLLKSYLINHVKIKNGNENIFKFDHITCEIEHDICRVNIRFDYQDKLEQLEIKNTLLTEIYHDQANLVIISKGRKEQGLKFDITHKQRVVSFL